jgi:branched-subunit amino acid transport protein
MRPILKIVSLLALIALILPSVFFLAGRMELDSVKWLMLLASIVWFVTATPWMWKDNSQQENA